MRACERVPHPLGLRIRDSGPVSHRVPAAVAVRMRDHVLRLAEEHSVQLVWAKRWYDADSIPGIGAAVVPIIKRPHDYFFALHEIGHVASKEARKWDDATDPEGTVIVEGAAWAWAVEQAIPALARYMRADDWDRVGYAFRTYLAWGASRPVPA